jgi:long-chain acyl-CoA synthetase
MMIRNLSQIFRNQAGKYNNRLAVEKRQQGIWRAWSWTEYYNTSKAFGLGLYSLGVRKGDRVALLSENRLEWLAADMGILGIGACTVPIYVTLLAPEVSYIISNSGSKIFIAENQDAVRKVLDEIDQCPTLEKIVVIETGGCDLSHPLLLSFEELLRLGRDRDAEAPGLFDTLTDTVGPDDLATLVYTSGTTGPPKGAMISHGNILAVFAGLDAVVPAYETDVTVPFLPLCHVFERIAGHFYGMKVIMRRDSIRSSKTLRPRNRPLSSLSRGFVKRSMRGLSHRSSNSLPGNSASLPGPAISAPASAFCGSAKNPCHPSWPGSINLPLVSFIKSSAKPWADASAG